MGKLTQAECMILKRAEGILNCLGHNVYLPSIALVESENTFREVDMQR